jgi:hypothetical protein
MSRLKKRTTSEILSAFKDMDFSNIEVGYLRNQIHTLFMKYTYTAMMWLPTTGKFHRAVKYKDRPTHKKFLIYPPPDITKLSRANLPLNPLFYCSGDPRATLFELRIQPGDTIVLSKWKLKEQSLFFPIGYSPDAFERLNSARNCPVIPSPTINSPQLKKENDRINRFFEESFTRIIPPNQEYLYKLTAIIAERFFKNKSDSKCGLMFPTIAMQANAENFALTPDLVDERLQFESAAWFVVEEARDFTYKVRKLFYSDFIDSDNQIIWEKPTVEESKYL